MFPSLTLLSSPSKEPKLIQMIHTHNFKRDGLLLRVFFIFFLSTFQYISSCTWNTRSSLRIMPNNKFYVENPL